MDTIAKSRFAAAFGFLLAAGVSAAAVGVRDVTTQTAGPGDERESRQTASERMTDLFSDIFTAAREGNWDEAERRFAQDAGATDSLCRKYQAHTGERIRTALSGRSANDVAKHMAHLVHLSIRNDFDLSLEEHLSNYRGAQERLQRCRERYERILGGNVRRRDEAIDRRIKAAFDRAVVAVGQVGVPPDEAAFRGARDEIVRSVKEVYTYFDEGR